MFGQSFPFHDNINVGGIASMDLSASVGYGASFRLSISGSGDISTGYTAEVSASATLTTTLSIPTPTGELTFSVR